MPVSPTFKLSYESVILDSEDVRILEQNEWFNDKLLTFIGEFLMNSCNSNAGNSREIHVFTPPETELIRHSGSDDEVEMYFGMLGIDQVPLIAFIVNNNVDVTRANGGSHWSLLIFDRGADQFLHFDSSNGYNHQIAENLMKKSKKLVKQRENQLKLTEERVLQQTNSRDCGLHVAQYLAVLVEKKSIKSIEMLEKIEKTREFWRDLILNFEK